MTQLVRLLALIVIGLMIPPSSVAFGKGRAGPDLILRNGRIFTGDQASPWVEAIAIAGDRIVAVGTDAAVIPTATQRTRIIDLGGRMTIPGINDAHDHVGAVPFGTEAVTKRPAMADPTLAEIGEAIAAAARSAPVGGWIVAQAGPKAMANTQLARVTITAAGGEHPVALLAWWGHGVIVNARGLAALRLDDRVTDMPGGHYERDASGKLTGKLEEYAGWAALVRLYTGAGKQATVSYLREYASRRLAEGVTSVQMMAGFQTPAQFVSALSEARIPLRVRAVRFPMPSMRNNGMAEWDGIKSQVTPLFSISGVKWVLDGTPMEELAYFTKPYRNRPDWFGRPNFSSAHLRAQLQQALTGKQPLLLHVIGDAMTNIVLTEMEKLAPAERWRPLRVRIEHANGLIGPNLARAKRLGIVIAQPRPTSPIRTWVAAGVPVAYGSDMGFPPFVAFARMTATDNPESVSRAEGLEILTHAGAVAEFAERDKGILKPGMLADLVVLSQDIMSAPTAELPKTRSVLTMVGGRVAYSAPEFAQGHPVAD